MKAILLFLILFSCNLIAQDSLDIENMPIALTKRYEVGYSFFTFNSSYDMQFVDPDKPVAEFLNGVLVRYKFRNFSLRLNASFFYRQTKKEYDPYCMECGHGRYDIKDYKIGAGIQHSFFKNKEYIYAYADFGYRRRFEIASLSYPATNSIINYKAKLNGIDAIIGLGTKLKLFKNLFFTVEGGYDYLLLKGKKTFNVSKDPNIKIDETNSNNFIGKVYLSLAF